MAACPQISLAELPDSSKPHMDFLDSTWFKTHGQTRDFPKPEHLRSLCKPHQLPYPVKFEDLGLVVKFGLHVSTTEAVNLWAIRRAFQDMLPVPEVYGWRVIEQDGKSEVFIYMQLIQGPTLQQQWSDMSAMDKHTICGDLRDKMSCLRSLRDSEVQQVIGPICHGPAIDISLEQFPLLRPFPSRGVLHDWLSWLW
ncbi:hypothetical protein C7974DRAFT_403479 [Boeremia exigua]|uniref:uncharacterized protein n=1 Tax=Boeremia exigua TaxID=749465 RepID=UPI001E8CC7D5|nr:uncharacterized protein C7974DRAFT_403479 [Boeremia exigua]KAH6615204.1 hypothetical protein C7974DRAFT_403479 [Boeremia exigua]